MEKTSALRYRHFDILLALFVALLLISNIAATKLLAIGPFIMDGGAILFPLTYIIGDVLAEVYGLKAAKRAIFTAFGVSALAALTFLAVQYLPGAPEYTNQAAFEAVLGFVPQIVIASLAAFLAGQFINAYVLIKIKEKWGEKHLWARLIGSTIAGQFVDTIIFCTIAFYGVITGWSFINYVLVGVAYKIAVEIILLPVTYRVVAIIKRQETDA
ncbi:hypothetical protein B7Y92_02455 [Candidatus Saccharibacteria bacterium 32-50-13]|nr:MAG: hypothetical protein B7Y92_02455 [Candidatus Saccharibacteria bacterium 32-50-13]